MTAPSDSPTSGTWHDQAPDVGDAALTALRLSKVTDPDRDRVRGKAAAAMRLIDQRLDLLAVAGRMTYLEGGVPVVTYASGDAPSTVMEAAVLAAVELYRRKDAPFGVLVGAFQGADAVRISGDPLAGVQHLLQPYCEGLGGG